VDKDLASSILATQIKADEFYVLTDVPFVYLNYGETNEQKLEFLNHTDTLKYLEAGTFGEGNMAPKIRAALSFIEKGGRQSIITESKKLEDKSFGTKITMEYDVKDLHKYD
jgi:carbamate kinase